MKEIEFLEITGEIERFYEKEYNQEQRKYIFENFKIITKERYRQVEREAFKTCRYMPKLADLIEIEHNLPKEKVQERKRVECKACNGTGIIIYTKPLQDGDRQIDYQYVARCNCENAKGMSKIIPLATEVWI